MLTCHIVCLALSLSVCPCVYPNVCQRITKVVLCCFVFYVSRRQSVLKIKYENLTYNYNYNNSNNYTEKNGSKLLKSAVCLMRPNLIALFANNIHSMFLSLYVCKYVAVFQCWWKWWWSVAALNDVGTYLLSISLSTF